LWGSWPPWSSWVTALATVSEIMLPLTFAAVLAIVFKPLG
jgi:predicted PurR-regulated permease PerM